MPQTKTAAPVLQHRNGQTKNFITCILLHLARVCKVCANFALLACGLGALCAMAALGQGGGAAAMAFIGLPMVADMLILLGGGAAVIAIALVVIWLAIWLFIRMVIGWVRLLVRLGKRWCRKEIAA